VQGDPALRKMPSIAQMTNKPNCIKGTFFFDPDDKIYEVHFPSNPVVPGSVIVQAFMTAGNQAGFFIPRILENFRFKKFVSPGTYEFIIEASSDVMECRLFHEGKALVTGRMKK
jgi:3-hydroxyacyl-[acyl-carrier-protein] dehydratase